MKKVTFNELTKITTELMLMEKMVELMPDVEVPITLEDGDKKTICEIDLSEDLSKLKEVLDNTLKNIAEKMNEIYCNSVDDREGYPEDSTAKKALWLDDVQCSVGSLRNQIRNRKPDFMSIPEGTNEDLGFL